MTIELSSSDLDAIFEKWYQNYLGTIKRGLDQYYSIYKIRYKNFDRRSRIGQQFENWLWENGIKIIQREKELYGVVFNDENLVLFLLEHA